MVIWYALRFIWTRLQNFPIFPHSKTNAGKWEPNFLHLLYHSNEQDIQIQPHANNKFRAQNQVIETLMWRNNFLEVRLVPGYSNRWSDHCQHPLADRLPWGENWACSHPLDFSVHPPSRTIRHIIYMGIHIYLALSLTALWILVYTTVHKIWEFYKKFILFHRFME